MLEMGRFVDILVGKLNFRFLRTLSFLVAAIGIVVAILWSPPDAYVTRRFAEAGLEMILFVFVIFSVLLGRRSLFWVWISFLFVLVLFVYSLIYKWQGLGENYFLIGGLLPWSDSYGYYNEAQRLLHGLNLTVWGARRPLLPAFLSVLLWITNNNLQFVLIIFTLLNAFAVYLAVREIQLNLKSSFAASIYLIISFVFYRRFAGTFMTENLGFLLGNLALVLFLQGIYEDKIKKIYWGMFVLTVGLNARAGAFFVLPVLAVWMVYVQQHKFVWWKIFIGAVCVIFLGMASNLLLLKLIGPTVGAVPFSNFSYTFYGLASGNKGWDQVLRDHPNLKEEDVPALAIEKFKEDPYMLVIGITRAYRSFTTASHGAFSFSRIQSPQRELLSSFLWVLTIIGLIFSIAQIKRYPHLSFACASFLGILFSVSLLPPVDADKMRVYAATIPLAIYIISIGISVPETIYRNYLTGLEASVIKDEALYSTQSVVLPLSVFLLCTMFVGPLLIKQSGSLPEVEKKVACTSDAKQVHFLMGSGSSIIIESDGIAGEQYIPRINISNFQNSSRVHDTELQNALFSLKSGDTLNFGTEIDASSDEENIRSVFLISPNMLKPGYYELCAAPSESELLQTYPFYYDLVQLKENNQSVSHVPDETGFKVSSFYSLVIWILFALLIMDLFQALNFPLKIIPLVLINTLVIVAGFLMLIHCLGFVPIQWQSVSLNVENAKRSRNFMYQLNLDYSWMSKTGIWDYPVRLYENNIELQYSDKVLIASEGQGRFVIMDGNLYFSSSDNSVPHENGRQYEIRWPVPVRIRYQWITYLLAVLSLAVHIKYFNPRGLSVGVR